MTSSRILAAATWIALATPALAEPQAELAPVASFPHQVTGVAVSADGRIFVNFPRWTEDAPVSVAELKDGKAVPYPDADWNSWRNARKDELDPKTHFVCVQSVVTDGRGRLWVLDPAAPALEQVVKGGPKLVAIDLASNKVVRTIPFDERVATQGSYLNDIRFSPDGRWGYLTDSGRGALLVVDLETGEARRLLDGVSSTQAEPGVQVHIDGRPLRRPDGRSPSFAADGLALSPDGETLFWQAISSHTLYAIPTAALRDPQLQTPDLEKQIRKAGETVVADGLWTAKDGSLLFTAVEHDAVERRDPDGRFTTLVSGKRLRWPDSLAEGPNGDIYVTASHIPDSPWFKEGAPIAVKSALFRFAPHKAAR